MSSEREMSLDLFHEEILLGEIMSKLSPTDVASLCCVSRRFEKLTSTETLWDAICSAADLPHSPRTDNSTFKKTYYNWRKGFEMYPWSLVKRVKRYIDSLRSWMSLNFPEAGLTMREGASEDELNNLEVKLGVKLPVATRVLYRLFDGQGHQEGSKESKDKYDTKIPLDDGLGVIGGYGFVNHSVNVYLLPVSEVITNTMEFLEGLGWSSSKYIVVAASTADSEDSKKMFLLDCASGQIHVGTMRLNISGEMIPCVPNRLLACDSIEKHGMLLWLEEHSRRLHNGFFRVHVNGDIRSISLFPRQTPFCSTAITHGVQISASSVFAPELSDPFAASRSFLFGYSVRARLLCEGCLLNDKPFTSCQLYRENLNIWDNGTVTTKDGAAFRGKNPILKQDREEFVSEDYTKLLLASSGSIDGFFTGVPGSSTNPTGGPFEVEVASFQLQLPEWIF